MANFKFLLLLAIVAALLSASQAEEADSTKKAANLTLSDLKKEAAKDINYLLDLFCPYLKMIDPSKNFSLDRDAAKNYLKQNPGSGLLSTLTGPLCAVLFLANKTTSNAGPTREADRTKRAAKPGPFLALPGIVSSDKKAVRDMVNQVAPKIVGSDKKAVRDLINKVANDVSSLLSVAKGADGTKKAAKLSNLADKFRLDKKTAMDLADTVSNQVASLLSLTGEADGTEKATKLSNLVKIFSFDRKAARDLLDKVVNEVSSLLRLAEEADGTKKDVEIKNLVEKLFHDKKAAIDLAYKVANEVAPVLSLTEEADGTEKAAKLSNLKVPQRMDDNDSLPYMAMLEGIRSCPTGEPAQSACIAKHFVIWCDNPEPCYGIRDSPIWDEADKCAEDMRMICWGWDRSS